MNYTGIVCLICFVIFCLIMLGFYAFIKRHTLGTFKYDNSGETYRCRMEFDSLDEVEKLHFAIVKIKEEDLGVPGEKRPQY